MLKLAKRDMTNPVVRDLIDPTADIVGFTDVTNEEEFWSKLECCAKAYHISKYASDKIRLAIGKLLLCARDHPEFYLERGFRTYDEFLRLGVCEQFGISRADAYEARKLVERWPSLDLNTYNKVGYSKMRIIARVSDENSSVGRQLIEIAPSVTLTKLRELIAEKGLASEAELRPAVIMIQTTGDIKKRFEEFINSPEIQAYCGTKDVGVILLRMVEECHQHWMASYYEELQAKVEERILPEIQYQEGGGDRRQPVIDIELAEPPVVQQDAPAKDEFEIELPPQLLE